MEVTEGENHPYRAHHPHHTQDTGKRREKGVGEEAAEVTQI